MAWRSYIPFLFVLTLCACGYDDFGPYAPAEENIPAANIDISEIAALYDGSPKNIYDDLVVSGWVTADDRSGNFYRVFMMDDGTGALEIRAGTYDLHNIFPVGRNISVRLKGLVVGSYNGVLQVGLPPITGSGYQTDYFGVPAVVRRYVFPGDRHNVPQPVTVATDALTEEMCGRLVRIEGVSLVADEIGGGTTWAVPFSGPGTKPETGYRVFTDGAGGEIAVETSGYADFAGDAVPTGKISITGILSKGKTDTGRTMYIVKMRDAGDAEAI